MQVKESMSYSVQQWYKDTKSLNNTNLNATVFIIFTSLPHLLYIQCSSQLTPNRIFYLYSKITRILNVKCMGSNLIGSYQQINSNTNQQQEETDGD